MSVVDNPYQPVADHVRGRLMLCVSLYVGFKKRGRL
jgi:hypothetical protein